MPEKALPGIATNTAQPMVAIGKPATETEVALAGVVAPSGTQTAVGSPATE